MAKTKPIKSIALVYRIESELAKTKAFQLCQDLTQKKIKVFSHPSQNLPKPASKYSGKEKLDLVVVLGGDGTYLEAIRMVKGQSLPFLGVNLGSLGFLTAHRVEDLDHVVQLALTGKMAVQKRSLLEVRVVDGKSKTKEQWVALNDFVIERGSTSHLIHLKIDIGGQPVSDIKADGLIIASPTGSTAYNLAAGGPILHPFVHAVVATPICPHSLTSRPFIFPDDQTVSLALVGKQKRAMVTVDGVKTAEIKGGEKVCVRKSKSQHMMLRKPDHNYFALLRDKLKFGERA